MNLLENILTEALELRTILHYVTGVTKRWLSSVKVTRNGGIKTEELNQTSGGKCNGLGPKCPKSPI